MHNYAYSLPTKGLTEIMNLKLDNEDKEIENEIKEVKKKFNSLSLSQLINYVYTKYPESIF